jgi:hypothetical protein
MQKGDQKEMKPLALMLTLTLLMVIGSSVVAREREPELRFKTRMVGFQETPAILSDGTGTFRATLDKGGRSISFTERFSNLSSDVTASHIHFGQPGVAGAVFVFFCGGGGKPGCPTGGGTITGTITGADVLGVAAQGITAGSFDDLLSILRSGNAYVNVHTTLHPGGEIRGQVKVLDDDDD